MEYLGWPGLLVVCCYGVSRVLLDSYLLAKEFHDSGSYIWLGSFRQHFIFHQVKGPVGYKSISTAQ